MYTYTWYQWLAFFYVYCFLGWIFESTYVSLKQKRLVNRGFLRLPMLPLYGSGAVMMLWVSLSDQGIAIIMISSDLPEILGMSDRVAVFKDGRVTAVLDRKDADSEIIMKYATGKLS